MNALRKQLGLFRLQLLTRLQYRFNFLSSIILANLDVVALVLLWGAIFKGKEIVNGYSQAEVVSYFVTVRLMSSFLLHNVSIDLGSDIKGGSLTTSLLAPRPQQIWRWV